jgi:hypothetical protein
MRYSTVKTLGQRFDRRFMLAEITITVLTGAATIALLAKLFW